MFYKINFLFQTILYFQNPELF